jgi:hypothetical protein
MMALFSYRQKAAKKTKMNFDLPHPIEEKATINGGRTGWAMAQPIFQLGGPQCI